jgi:hypothetical protein
VALITDPRVRVAYDLARGRRTSPVRPGDPDGLVAARDLPNFRLPNQARDITTFLVAEAPCVQEPTRSTTSRFERGEARVYQG